MTPAIQIHAGRAALAHIQTHGLRAQDIAVIPAAAGGAKELILQALDQWVFGEWLPSAPRERSLIGSSIGAWRLAAACHTDSMAAFKRLGDAYCEQSYARKPAPQHVTQEITVLLQKFLAGHEAEILAHPQHRLHVIATLGRGLLKTASANGSDGMAIRSQGERLKMRLGFAVAAASNLHSRRHLASHIERVVIGDVRDPLFWMRAQFDAFETHFMPLRADNLAQVLLASSSRPLQMLPVQQIAGLPLGRYWDGGLIDYHPTLPYSRVAGNKEGGLVLLPHYCGQIFPGWFDKHLPWRSATSLSPLNPHRAWLDNVVMVSPSPAFLKILPFARLPSRQDFSFYAGNDRLRMQSWKLAMTAGHYLRDAFAAFVERPNLAQIKPIN